MAMSCVEKERLRAAHFRERKHAVSFSTDAMEGLESHEYFRSSSGGSQVYSLTSSLITAALDSGLTFRLHTLLIVLQRLDIKRPVSNRLDTILPVLERLDARLAVLERLDVSEMNSARSRR